MEIINKDGNLLNTEAELILHQVNCYGVMGSGVAKAIREKWPVVFNSYYDFCSSFVEENSSNDMLGMVQPVAVSDSQTVANLFAQKNYGYDGKRYTSYDAIDTCLKKVRDYCIKKNIKTVALPFHMSCDRGGANWNIIMEMLKEHFEKTDIKIEIWKL